MNNTSSNGGWNGEVLKFREDGLREPPLFTASNNLIIMIVGLSLLIVPIVGVFVCMCARSKFLRGLRGMKLMSGKEDPDGSGLPYSHFDSETENESRKPDKLQVIKSVRVLLNNDNVTVINPCESPNAKIQPYSATQNDASSAIVDVDATFILPIERDNSRDASYS